MECANYSISIFVFLEVIIPINIPTVDKPVINKVIIVEDGNQCHFSANHISSPNSIANVKRRIKAAIPLVF